jgi:aspartyl/asparaginyl-tRNA synthetase
MMLTFLEQFTMLELVFALQNSWTEIIDLADGLLVHLVRLLQEREKYKTLTQLSQRCHPLAGDFKLGLDDQGKLKRITFSEAKAILRNALGREADDNVDFT